MLRHFQQYLEGVPRPLPDATGEAVICPTFRIGDRRIRTIGMTMRFGPTVAVAPWPGNVRELLGVAERLVVESTDHPDLDVDDFIRRELARSARLAREEIAEQRSSAASSPRAPSASKRGDITLQQLLDALTRARWNKSKELERSG